MGDQLRSLVGVSISGKDKEGIRERKNGHT